MILNIRERVTSNGNNTFLRAPGDANILVTELQLIIALPSIVEIDIYADDPLLTDEQRNAIFWREARNKPHKKVVTFVDDFRLLEFIVFNRFPYYVEDLLARFTAQSTFVLQAGSSLRVEVEGGNSGALGVGDSLKIWGQAEVLAPSGGRSLRVRP